MFVAPQKKVVCFCYPECNESQASPWVKSGGWKCGHLTYQCSSAEEEEQSSWDRNRKGRMIMHAFHPNYKSWSVEFVSISSFITANKFSSCISLILMLGNLEKLKWIYYDYYGFNSPFRNDCLCNSNLYRGSPSRRYEFNVKRPFHLRKKHNCQEGCIIFREMAV